LHQVKRFTLHIHPVLEVFVNDDKTRTFLALKVSSKPVLAVQLVLATSTPTADQAVAGVVPDDPLLQAIDAVSDAFEIEGLQRFYDTPRPHISLGWLLGDQSEALSAALVSDGGGGGNKLAAALESLRNVQWEVEPEAICCKIGQVNYSIWKNRR
jgi:hypothetical protein